MRYITELCFIEWTFFSFFLLFVCQGYVWSAGIYFFKVNCNYVCFFFLEIKNAIKFTYAFKYVVVVKKKTIKINVKLILCSLC